MGPFGTSLRLDEFLWFPIFLHKLALAHMSSGIRSPDLVPNSTLLTLSVLVRAAGVHTRVEFAGGLKVCEFASFGLAVGTVAAKRHVGVLEMAELVGAMWVEPAHFLCLVRSLNGG